MSFKAKMHADDGEVTIRLQGELDGRAAPGFNDMILEAADERVNRLVLLMDQLTYLSSAGLRCLVFAHQKMPQGTEIVLVGTRPEVAETIKLTGFDHSIVLQEPVDGQ